MKQTWIRYGDVILKNVLVRSWAQESVFDESGTDQRCQKHVISVEAYCVRTGATATPPITQASEVIGMFLDSNQDYAPDSNKSAPMNQHNIRAQLLKPRQRFIFTLGMAADGTGGDVMFNVAAQPRSGTNLDGYDVKNGPKPLRCVISNIAGNESMRVRWDIEVNVAECSDGLNPGNTSGILSNRWSMTDDIDRNFSTTRTIQGRLITSNGNLSPHQFRGWVVPRLQQGFRREKMSFTASADGLQLDYTIIDQEVGYSAPAPATSWELRHTEAMGDGKMIRTSASVSLRGPRDVSHGSLITLAVYCLHAKTWKGLQPNQYIMDDFQITDYYSDDAHGIDASCAITRAVSDKGEDVVGDMVRFATDRIGRPIKDADLAAGGIGYNSNRSKGGYDNDAILTEGPLPITSAFIQYLQTPCDDTHATGDAEPPSKDETERDRGTTDITERVVDALPEKDETQISDSHFENPYTHYRVISKYLTDEHIVGLPIASQMPVGSSSGSSSSGGTGSKRTQGFVMLAPPTSRRIIRLEAQRLGRQPQLPEFPRKYTVSVGGVESDAVRLEFTVSPVNPERQANGGMMYVVSAEATYGLEAVADLKEQDLAIGGIPWLDGPLANAVLTKDAISATNTIDSILGNNGLSDID